MRYQPQCGPIVVVREWAARNLKFASAPALGHYNAAQRSAATQRSGSPTLGTSPSGINVEPGTRALFSATVDASKGLTIISVWRARTGGNYFGGDGQPVLVGTRSAGNQGWSWGHDTAIGGASNGNLVPQTLTFQGIAQYAEQNATIEAFVDTPVACRYDPATGLISWFRFGEKSSPDTAASSPSAGTGLVIGAQGDYSGGINPWLDRYSSLLVFEAALSDAEIRRLSKNAHAPNQVFITPDEEDFLLAGGGSSFSYTAAGGFVLSGAAANVRGRAKVASGGIVTGGAAAVARRAQRAASGGLTLGGAAVAAKGRAIVTAGGLTLSGTASTLRGVARTAAGGITLAGAATVSFLSAVQSRVVVGAGGFMLSGIATVRRSIRKFALGGITFSGAASISRSGADPYPAQAYASTIMHFAPLCASVPASETSIAVTGGMSATFATSSIMKSNPINRHATMSNAALNLTGNLL